MKLTPRQRTKAVQSYARRKGFSASTVRANTALFYAACSDYRAKQTKGGLR